MNVAAAIIVLLLNSALLAFSLSRKPIHVGSAIVAACGTIASIITLARMT